MKVGIFGGSFNPIHFGHINLAIELKEKGHLDEVWFVPAALSPFRLQEKMAQGRMKMVELAIEDIEGFKALDIELKRAPPSYTIDTIKEIFKLFPDYEFFLIFGQDVALGFEEWKQSLDIINLIPLMVGSRKKIELANIKSLEIKKAILKGLIETPLLDIESTVIRERLKNKKYCGHLVPSKVLDYIDGNELYFNA